MLADRIAALNRMRFLAITEEERLRSEADVIVKKYMGQKVDYLLHLQYYAAKVLMSTPWLEIFLEKDMTEEERSKAKEKMKELEVVLGIPVR